jgi:hypothetical protein
VGLDKVQNSFAILAWHARKQQALGNAENNGVGTDSYSERKQGRCGKNPVLPKQA